MVKPLKKGEYQNYNILSHELKQILQFLFNLNFFYYILSNQFILNLYRLFGKTINQIHIMVDDKIIKMYFFYQKYLLNENEFSKIDFYKHKRINLV